MPKNRVETHSKESSFSFLPPALVRNWFRSTAEKILGGRSNETLKQAGTFELIDIFSEVLSLFQKGASEQEVAEFLSTTLETQLTAAQREHLHLPYQADVLEIDLPTFAAEGRLHIFHPGYGSSDIRDSFAKGAEFAPTAARRLRFSQEATQFDLLCDRLWDDLTAENESGEIDWSRWSSGSAGEVIPDSLRSSLGVSRRTEVFSHNRHVLALPQNLEIYPDATSYTNVYQLVYIPELKRLIVVSHHLYKGLEPSLQADQLQLLSQEFVPSNKIWTAKQQEAALLSFVGTLPESLRSTPVAQVLFETWETVMAQQRGQSHLNQDQNSAWKEFKSSQPNIRRATAFLTQVLIAEVTVCRRDPSAMKDLLIRLNVALEMVFNPLFSGASLNISASKQSYLQMLSQHFSRKNYQFGQQDTRIQSWVETYKQQMSDRPNQPWHVLQKSAEKLQHESRTIAGKKLLDSPIRTEAIQNLAKRYPNILNRVVGEATCAAGQFGGLSSSVSSSSGMMSEMFGSLSGMSFPEFSSLLQSGPFRHQSQVASIFGAERAENFHLGVCRYGSECHFPGIQQMVGECDVCAHCEILPKEQYDSWQTHNNSDVQEWLKSDFSDVSQAIDSGEHFWKVPVSVMVTAFTPGGAKALNTPYGTR